jgi:hypothetical protein
LLGYTDSYGAGNSDFWLIKTDSEGNEEWNKTIGGIENESGYAVNEIAEDVFIILGSTNSYGAGSSDYYLVKVGYNPPSSFSLISPADGDTVYSYMIEFDWEDSEDPYSGDISYDLYLDTDDGFSNPIIIHDLTESEYTNTEELENNRTFYWKICATSEEGKSTWSNDTRSFITNYEYWGLINAEANDGSDEEEGIDDDDYVVLTFDRSTDKPEIDASNIDDIFRLSGGHTWLDGAGRIGEAIWNIAGDKLAIYLSTHFTPPTVAPGDTITPDYYSMTQTQCVISGSFNPSGVGKSNVPSDIPAELTLYPNRPNPFNPVTTISVGIPGAGRVIVSIFDLRGRLVSRLYDGMKSAGTASFVWEAQGMASGVYICRVEMPERGSVQTRKMLLLK